MTWRSRLVCPKRLRIRLVSGITTELTSVYFGRPGRGVHYPRHSRFRNTTLVWRHDSSSYSRPPSLTSPVSPLDTFFTWQRVIETFETFCPIIQRKRSDVHSIHEEFTKTTQYKWFYYDYDPYWVWFVPTQYDWDLVLILHSFQTQLLRRGRERRGVKGHAVWNVLWGRKGQHEECRRSGYVYHRRGFLIRWG